MIFIEPYPKSLTKKLYVREITTDESRGELDDPVRFEPFVGVAPSLYQKAFGSRHRKGDSGEIVELKRVSAVPVGASFVVSNPQLEENLSSKVDQVRAEIQGANP